MIPHLEPLEPRNAPTVSSVPPPEAVLVEQMYDEAGSPGYAMYVLHGDTDYGWLVDDTGNTSTWGEAVQFSGRWGVKPIQQLNVTLAPPTSAPVLEFAAADPEAEQFSLAIYMLDVGDNDVLVQQLSADAGASWDVPLAVNYDPLTPEGEAAEIVDLGNGFYAKEWADEDGEWFAWSDDMEQWSVLEV